MTLINTILYSVWFLLVGVYTLATGIFLCASVRRMSPDRIDNPPPRVSLVIPTYNEAGVITQKLENVLQLEYPRNRLQVIVVDSASTDSTREKVRRFSESNQGKLDVLLVEQQARAGKSAAINEALRYSEGEVFALTDADAVVEPGTLSKLVGYLHNASYGGASGVEVPIGTRNLMSRVEAGYKSIYAAMRMAEANLDTPLMCESEFSVFRRQAITPLKPGCMCDDLELTVSIRSHDMKAAYISNAPFYEREAGSLRPKLLHKYRRGMANQHGLLRSWRVLFNRSFGKYGAVIFPFEFFVHLGSPLLFALTIGLFAASAISTPGALPTELAVVVVSGLIPLAMLRQLTRKYKSDAILPLGERTAWLFGAVAFLLFQFVLVGSLTDLVLRGPKLHWRQISETRTLAEAIVSPIQAG